MNNKQIIIISIIVLVSLFFIWPSSNDSGLQTPPTQEQVEHEDWYEGAFEKTLHDAPEFADTFDDVNETDRVSIINGFEMLYLEYIHKEQYPLAGEMAMTIARHYQATGNNDSALISINEALRLTPESTTYQMIRDIEILPAI